MSSIVLDNKSFFQDLGSLTRRKIDPIVLDVEEMTIENKCRTILCLVDKNNIDSLVGAALWISKLDFDKNISVHSFHPLEPNPPAGDYDQVINFGCYIPEKYLKGYMGKHHTKMFVYRNMYQNLKGTDSLEIIRPCDDWYGAEQALVDNSITYNVNQEMFTKEKPSSIICLVSLVRDIALHINYAHKGIKTIEDQVKIHNLRVTLERAFSKSNIRDAIRDLRLIDDPDGYRLRLEQVRQISMLHGKETLLVIPGKGLMGVPRHFIIDAFSCPTGMSRDVMKTILPVKGSCITYESIAGYNLYRFVTEDKKLSRIFATQMKATHIWEEGETIVALVPHEKK